MAKTSGAPPTMRQRKGKHDDDKAKRQPATGQAKPAAATDPHSAYYVGKTRGGITFDVPPTFNVLHSFLPQNLNPISIFLIALMSLQAYVMLYTDLSVRFCVGICVFWRCAYNVGLGAILHYQSHYQSWSNWYARVVKRSESARGVMLRLAKYGIVDASYDIAAAPDEYCAWLVYKHFVNIILVCDAYCFFLLGLRCFVTPTEFSWMLVSQYLVALAAVAFNYWAKVDAHRCIGEYCWYWGDFFFRKEQELTFDGIFELFPHPMYTVGYTAYYGAAMASRSYTVLFFALFSHMLQMAFLILVEEPHIERMYGQDVSSNSQSSLYDVKSSAFPEGKQSKFLFNLNPFRSGDIHVLILAGYGIGFSVAVTNPLWCVVQVLCWRVFHWIGLGYCLWAQSTRNMLTEHHARKGRSLYDAFSHWKRIYNTSVTMNVVVFVGCAVRYFIQNAPESVWAAFSSPGFLSRQAVGLVLIAMNVWASMSTYQAVGNFGWFYGDFFITKSEFQPKLVYTGIYRFLNNPDAVVGFVGLYGAALMASSNVLLLLAIVSQALNFVFLNVVEIPHMKKIYQDQTMRDQAPVSRVLNDKLLNNVRHDPTVEKAQKVVRKQVHAVKQKAFEEMHSLYTFMNELRANRRTEAGAGQTNQTSVQVVQIQSDTELVIGEPLDVQVTTSTDHSSQDWVGVFAVDAPNTAGQSNGCWEYVPVGANPTVRFVPDKLPTTCGFYEIRYMLANEYDPICRMPLLVGARLSSPGPSRAMSRSSQSSSAISQ